MTKEEAIEQLQNCKGLIKQDGQDYLDERDIPILDMAIEALSADAVGYETTATINEPIIIQSNYVYVVRCKDCIHQDHCHETVAHTRHHDDFIEYWSETIEWCSRGERREP